MAFDVVSQKNKVSRRHAPGLGSAQMNVRHNLTVPGDVFGVGFRVSGGRVLAVNTNRNGVDYTPVDIV